MEYCDIVDLLDLKPENESKLVREFYEKESLWDRVISYLKGRCHTLTTQVVRLYQIKTYEDLCEGIGLDEEQQCEQAWEFLGDHDLFDKFEEWANEKLADRLPQPEEDHGECPMCDGTGTGNPHLGWRGVGCEACQGLGYIKEGCEV